MNLQINYIPVNWNYGCSFSFEKWYKEHVKSHHPIREDYNLINKRHNDN